MHPSQIPLALGPWASCIDARTTELDAMAAFWNDLTYDYIPKIELALVDHNCYDISESSQYSLSASQRTISPIYLSLVT